MKTKALLLAAISFTLAITSCKKKDVNGDVSFHISYFSDAFDLEWDTLKYQNQAGNRYSVTRLQYYLSKIQLGSTAVDPFSSNAVFYIDASKGTDFQIQDIPNGSYNSMTVTIGIDNARNIVDGLPNTVDNSAMVWPDMMGGGYHFMKFEGNYLDTLGHQEGFAMHLGKSGNQVVCTFPINLQLDEDGGSLDLHMNLNEWFRNPHTYDFNVDGVSIMINDAALQKIAGNGVDVFY